MNINQLKYAKSITELKGEIELEHEQDGIEDYNEEDFEQSKKLVLDFLKFAQSINITINIGDIINTKTEIPYKVINKIFFHNPEEYPTTVKYFIDDKY